MKRILSVLILGMVLLAPSCKKEEPPVLKGSLSLSLNLSLDVYENNSRLKATSALEDFRVFIFDSDSLLVQSWSRLADVPDTIELAPGDYFVTADSGDELPAVFSIPYYHGSSELFTVSSMTHSEVSIACTLHSAIVSVHYSENIVSAFSSFTTSVSNGSDSLVYDMNESRYGYFHPQPLSIRVNLTHTDLQGTTTNYFLSGAIPSPQPNHHYRVEVDATLAGGSSSFIVSLDTTGMVTEIIPITGIGSVEPDTIIPDTTEAELLITEIMYDPAALSDTEGEWLEVYNNSGETINLYGLLLLRDNLYGHVISDTILLLPGEYYVLARTATATAVTNQYVYGSTISLSNTGSVLSLHRGGTVAAPGPLIFSVDYGASGFPTGSGSSICLDPSKLSESEATSGSSWCTSTSVFSTGDKGTPGSINDLCGK